MPMAELLPKNALFIIKGVLLLQKKGDGLRMRTLGLSPGLPLSSSVTSSRLLNSGGGMCVSRRRKGSGRERHGLSHWIVASLKSNNILASSLKLINQI